MIMKFEYSVYFRQNFIVPLCLLVFCFIFFIPSIIRFVIDLIHKAADHSIGNLIKHVAFLLILSFLVTLNLIPLMRGGFFLLFEREKDAIEIEGTIEELDELSWFGGSKYDFEQNHGNGETIVINGVKYYLMTYGTFQLGDCVIIKVLPKSKLILEIEHK